MKRILIVKRNMEKCFSWFFLLAMAVIYSCSSQDDYLKYVEGGEISYTGKVDSVVVYSGRNRVLVSGLFISDPKISECRIFWGNRSDSLTIPVTRTENVDTLLNYIENLAEGIYNFEIVTYDNLGNKSLTVNRVGTVYGENYQLNLNNRPIISAATSDEGITTLEWGGLDLTTGVFESELLYTDDNNEEQLLIVPIDSSQTILPEDYQVGTPINYRTKFLPDTLCIDTFYTDYTLQDVYVPDYLNITVSYILNAGFPFNYSSLSSGGRWGVLADWITTDNVKNYTGGYGGYEIRSGVGVMSMEAGWSSNTLGSFTNGKIYQTFLLPAGKYAFEATVSSAGATGDKYIVVAKGNILPDIEYLDDKSLNYVSISNSITVNTAKTVDFVLTEDTQISIGMVGTLVGTGSTGQYIKINGVRLLQYF